MFLCLFVFGTLSKYATHLWYFNGVVSNVYQEKRGDVYFTVNGDSFSCAFYKGLGSKVQVGDSISKKRGTNIIAVVSKSNGQHLIFTDN